MKGTRSWKAQGIGKELSLATESCQEKSVQERQRGASKGKGAAGNCRGKESLFRESFGRNGANGKVTEGGLKMWGGLAMLCDSKRGPAGEGCN